MKRVSFIDLGSNSARFVIMEIGANGSYQLIYQQKEAIRLSEGMWEEQSLTKEAMDRAIATLQNFAHMAAVMEVHEIYAVATAAVRLARNGKDFTNRVKKDTGIDLQCISGEEEAYLGYLGVINTIGLTDFIMFDLGGASVEVSLVENRRVVQSVSLPMGALTLTGSFQKGKEMTEAEAEKMCAHIRAVLGSERWLSCRKLPLIGVGGTARNLAKMDQRAHDYPIAKLHNYRLSRERIEGIYNDVRSKKLAQRRKIQGLSAERADIIIAGTALIYELLKYTGAEEMRVSGCGLREGLFYRYYGEHYLNPDGVIEDILIHSAENVLLGMPQNDLVHAKYIANLSDMLYEQWDAVYHWGPRAQKLLKVASLLHDIGKRINYYSHARHSAYMIVNSNLYGLSHREQAFCSFLAAFSHGTNNKFVKGSPYGELLTDEDKVSLTEISLLLALAEAIDESHEQSAVSLSTVFSENSITITVWTKRGCNNSVAEVAVSKLYKQCKKDFKRDLIVKWREAL